MSRQRDLFNYFRIYQIWIKSFSSGLVAILKLKKSVSPTIYTLLDRRIFSFIPFQRVLAWFKYANSLVQVLDLGNYIYIYCHLEIDCFVVSQLYSVARHVRHLKLGLKSTQLYVRLTAQPTSEPHQLGNYKALCSSIRLFTFLPYWIPECSIHLKSFRFGWTKYSPDQMRIILA